MLEQAFERPLFARVLDILLVATSAGVILSTAALVVYRVAAAEEMLFVVISFQAALLKGSRCIWKQQMYFDRYTLSYSILYIHYFLCYMSYMI